MPDAHGRRATTGGSRYGLTSPAGAAPEAGGRADGADRHGHRRRRARALIGLFQLSTIGIGATIGTGIFFVLSQAVPIAGPAVVWSFVVAGVVAGLTAVC